MLLRIWTIEEIETEILKAKKGRQNFPRTLEFPFSERYKNIVTQIKSTEISSETIIYDSVEAANENKDFHWPDHWCFAENGQGDRWLLNGSNFVFFYNHDGDERLEPMYITFEQWLQMAFVIRQLDEYCNESETLEESVKQRFYEVLHTIHPRLSENFPFSVS